MSSEVPLVACPLRLACSRFAGSSWWLGDPQLPGASRLRPPSEGLSCPGTSLAAWCLVQLVRQSASVGAFHAIIISSQQRRESAEIFQREETEESPQDPFKRDDLKGQSSSSSPK